jgi:hypothetical protein
MVDGTPMIKKSRELAKAIIDGNSAVVGELRAALATERAEATITGLSGELAPIAQLPPSISAKELPNVPGIYLISSLQENIHYIGLAIDIKERFYSPGYGHLVNNKCRSAIVIETQKFEIRILRAFDPKTESLDLELAHSEILLHTVLTVAGLRFVNSESMLGRVGGGVGAALIVCEIATGRYYFFGSTSLAVEVTGSTALPAVAHAYQNTAAGYAVRWATDTEIVLAEEVGGGSSVPRAGLQLDPETSERIASTSASVVAFEGKGRNASVRWTSGLLPTETLAHFRTFSRGGTYKANSLPKSGFNGVSWDSHASCWQCRAKSGPGPKDLWHTGRRSWGSPLDAAIAREEKVAAEGWQKWNIDRYASNATEINRMLGTPRFKGW